MILLEVENRGVEAALNDHFATAKTKDFITNTPTQNIA